MRYFDLHCDTMTECALKDIPLRENGLHVSLKTVESWERYVQCYAVWIPDDLRVRAPGSAFCRWPAGFRRRWRKTAIACPRCEIQET